MSEERIKVYVTKYALSAGISAAEVTVDGGGYAHPTSRQYGWTCYNRKEWFRTYGEALADAEKRRAKKIASLRKQIAAVEKRVFKDPTS